MNAADTSKAQQGRVIGKLTSVTVRQAKERGLYGDGGGLFLQVGATGGKSWVFRWKHAGKFRVMGLGPIHTISLAEARELARDCRKLRLEGRDPIDERRARRAVTALESAKAISFRECAEAYIAAHQAGWRNAKHVKEWPATLSTYVYPVFGSLPVQAVDVALVMRVLDPIWSEKPDTAGRVRGRIESILDWARALGYRQGENPARWRGHLDNLLPKKSKVRRVVHHAALPYQKIGAFMVELRKIEGTAARALEFTILTAARTAETIRAQWAEINFADGVWTIPSERMKSGREHRVALSDAALAVLKDRYDRREGDFVFPGIRPGRPANDQAMSLLLRRMGRGDLTVHGFRSTFSDWCAERSAFSSEVREMALAHAVGSKVEEAYRRGDLFDKRLQLAQAWAAYCAAPPAEGIIVPIRQIRAPAV
jgi:integrase